MVDSNPIVKTVNKYMVETHKLTLARPPNKVLKKQRKIIGRKRLATIQQAQYDTTASDRFLSTALHLVSKSITRANSHRIALPYPIK